MPSSFEDIFEEIRRQNDLSERLWDSLDKKFEVVIGISMTIVGFVVTQDKFFEIFKSNNYPSIGMFFLGIVLIVLAAYFAYRGFGVKNFKSGIDIDELVQLYGQDQKRDFQKIIGRSIFEATTDNDETVAFKADHLETSYFCLGTGVILIVLARLVTIFVL